MTEKKEPKSHIIEKIVNKEMKQEVIENSQKDFKIKKKTIQDNSKSKLENSINWIDIIPVDKNFDIYLIRSFSISIIKSFTFFIIIQSFFS